MLCYLGLLSINHCALIYDCADGMLIMYKWLNFSFLLMVLIAYISLGFIFPKNTFFYWWWNDFIFANTNRIICVRIWKLNSLWSLIEHRYSMTYNKEKYYFNWNHYLKSNHQTKIIYSFELMSFWFFVSGLYLPWISTNFVSYLIIKIPDEWSWTMLWQYGQLEIHLEIQLELYGCLFHQICNPLWMNRRLSKIKN